MHPVVAAKQIATPIVKKDIAFAGSLVVRRIASTGPSVRATARCTPKMQPPAKHRKRTIRTATVGAGERSE